MNRSFSQSRDVQITVSLSKLISSKRNPRRVKPERDAHRRMVASIRAYGLLAPPEPNSVVGKRSGVRQPAPPASV